MSRLNIIPRQSSTAQAGWQWHKVNTHVHSSVSADAFVDIGIHSQKAIENGSPLVRSYLRFDVQGLPGTVTRVTLCIFTNSSSSTGYQVHNVADNFYLEESDHG